MARNKNAIRRHLIADMTVDGAKPAEGDYLELAKWITDIEDATDEEVEDYAVCAGASAHHFIPLRIAAPARPHSPLSHGGQCGIGARRWNQYVRLLAQPPHTVPHRCRQSRRRRADAPRHRGDGTPIRLETHCKRVASDTAAISLQSKRATTNSGSARQNLPRRYDSTHHQASHKRAR